MGHLGKNTTALLGKPAGAHGEQDLCRGILTRYALRVSHLPLVKSGICWTVPPSANNLPDRANDAQYVCDGSGVSPELSARGLRWSQRIVSQRRIGSSVTVRRSMHVFAEVSILIVNDRPPMPLVRQSTSGRSRPSSGCGSGQKSPCMWRCWQTMV